MACAESSHSDGARVFRSRRRRRGIATAVVLSVADDNFHNHPFQQRPNAAEISASPYGQDRAAQMPRSWSDAVSRRSRKSRTGTTSSWDAEKPVPRLGWLWTGSRSRQRDGFLPHRSGRRCCTRLRRRSTGCCVVRKRQTASQYAREGEREPSARLVTEAIGSSLFRRTCSDSAKQDFVIGRGPTASGRFAKEPPCCC